MAIPAVPGTSLVRKLSGNLRGTKPEELPLQLSVKFIMTLNANTAKALGVTIPANLLALADEVIE